MSRSERGCELYGAVDPGHFFFVCWSPFSCAGISTIMRTTWADEVVNKSPHIYDQAPRDSNGDGCACLPGPDNGSGFPPSSGGSVCPDQLKNMPTLSGYCTKEYASCDPDKDHVWILDPPFFAIDVGEKSCPCCGWTQVSRVEKILTHFGTTAIRLSPQISLVQISPDQSKSAQISPKRSKSIPTKSAQISPRPVQIGPKNQARSAQISRRPAP